MRDRGLRITKERGSYRSIDILGRENLNRDRCLIKKESRFIKERINLEKRDLQETGVLY